MAPGRAVDLASGRDGFDQRVAGGDRNAGVGVGQRLLRRSLVWQRRLATTRLDFHAIVAKSPLDAVRLATAARPLPLAVARPVAGGASVAQMESGERGILPIDSSRDARNHRDPGRCRRQGCRKPRATPAGASPSARGSRRCGRRCTSARCAEAPNLPNSVLDSLVSSIIVEREQIGPNRYIADLGMLFDRARAGELLGVGGRSAAVGADAADPGDDQRRRR